MNQPRKQQLEVFCAHLLSFSEALKGLLPILSRSHLYNRGLKWALEREWLLLAWLLSKRVDFHRSRFFHALSELKKYPLPPQLGPEPHLLELEHAYKDYQQTITEKIGIMISPLRSSNVSQKLGEMLFSRYKASFRGQSGTLGGAPGSFLRRMAELIFSSRVYAEVFEPTLRDVFDEYCEALAANRPWKARWVRIRGYYSFWSAVFAQLPISAVKMIYKIWKATQ